MPGAIVVAATATGVQPPFALFLGALNVLKDSSAASYGTPVESIELVEAGPGGVSSMEFTVDDPAKVVSLTDWTPVSLWDLINNVCLFRGFVDHWSMTPGFGGQGRTVQVSCTGVEAWLDWLVVTWDPIVLWPGPTSLSEYIGAMANAAAPMLKAPSGYLAPFTRNGSFTYPVGSLFVGGAHIVNIWGGSPLVIGKTLREAINAYQAFSISSDGAGNVLKYGPALLVTVDFYMGLRLWEDDIALQPDDYTTLTVTDTTAGALLADTLEYALEPGDVIRAVYVKGGTAAATGWFGDGSGVVGREAYVDDPLLLTYAAAAARAMSIINTVSPQVRGSFDLRDFTPPPTVHAGSLLVLTDAATGATSTYRIYELAKRFNGSGRQDWHVSFGGLPPSSVRLVRKLTRAVAA